MTVTVEAKSAEVFSQRVAELALAAAALRSARADLRRAGQAEENKARQAALQARREAEAAVAAASVALDTKRRHLADLITRAGASDEDGDWGRQIAAAKEDVPPGETRMARVETEAGRVRRSTAAALSDNHLANLAADVIEGLTTSPVIVRSNPATAPDLSPMIVLSQTADTDSYGTLAANGSVAVAVVGESDLDWRDVERALADLGCEARVSPTRIDFDRAAWPLPRLSAPSSLAVRRLGVAAVEWWTSLIEQSEVRAYWEERGYMSRATMEALASIEDDTLTAEDGHAEGTLRLRLGVKNVGMGGEVNADNLLVEVRDVTTALTRRLGEVTEAGKLVSAELVSADRADGSVWNVPAKYRATGHALWPATITAEYRLTFAYQPAYAHEIAED
jgi:hypothetical protein